MPPSTPAFWAHPESSPPKPTATSATPTSVSTSTSSTLPSTTTASAAPPLPGPTAEAGSQQTNNRRCQRGGRQRSAFESYGRHRHYLSSGACRERRLHANCVRSCKCLCDHMGPPTPRSLVTSSPDLAPAMTGPTQPGRVRRRTRCRRRSAPRIVDNLTQSANLDAGFAKWSPESGESVHNRLAAIVGGAMGATSPRNLLWECRCDLGLVSLMADAD